MADLVHIPRNLAKLEKKKVAKKKPTTAKKKPKSAALKKTSGQVSVGVGKKAEKGRTTVIAGGKVFEVKQGLDFQKTIKTIAERAGLSRFHVYVDGVAVRDPSNSPSDFRGVHEQVVISRYDKGDRKSVV
jgi:hypothetical protein